VRRVAERGEAGAGASGRGSSSHSSVRFVCPRPTHLQVTTQASCGPPSATADTSVPLVLRRRSPPAPECPLGTSAGVLWAGAIHVCSWPEDSRTASAGKGATEEGKATMLQADFPTPTAPSPEGLMTGTRAGTRSTEGLDSTMVAPAQPPPPPNPPPPSPTTQGEHAHGLTSGSLRMTFASLLSAQVGAHCQQRSRPRAPLRTSGRGRPGRF
jgi:hypothetical protein